MDVDRKAATDALMSLAQDGIPPDVQELLVYGNPIRDIKPGALSRALKAALTVYAALAEQDK